MLEVGDAKTDPDPLAVTDQVVETLGDLALQVGDLVHSQKTHLSRCLGSVAFSRGRLQASFFHLFFASIHLFNFLSIKERILLLL